MKDAKITYSDGTIISTSINGTNKEIKEYFKLGKYFNIGIVTDNMQKVVKCEIL